MKKTLMTLLTMVFINFLFNSCEKDDIFEYGMKPVSFITKDIKNVTTCTAICEIRYNSVVRVNGGIVYSTSPNPTTDNGEQYVVAGQFKTVDYSFNLVKLKDATTYYVRAYVNYDDRIIYGEEFTFKTRSATGWINGHAWVDMGLPSGLKWATCNVGASSPEDYGNYYAWGETYTKDYYVNDNCETYGEDIASFSGNPTYDVARKVWGESWRVPTYGELKELKNYCTWTWITENGINGYKVTGPNGASIFFPAAGYRWDYYKYGANVQLKYWSSTPNNNNDVNHQYGADMDLNTEYGDWERDWSRGYGQSVRPVSE